MVWAVTSRVCLASEADPRLVGLRNFVFWRGDVKAEYVKESTEEEKRFATAL